MPKEATSSADEPPPPNSQPQPRKLEECIKIRTGQLLRHRELCGNTIISRGRSKRSFRARYRKAHAMKPTMWNYDGTKNKASVSLEELSHGLVDRDILLTGGEKNIIQMFQVGADEHGTVADCALPQNIPRNSGLVQRLGWITTLVIRTLYAIERTNTPCTNPSPPLYSLPTFKPSSSIPENDPLQPPLPNAVVVLQQPMKKSRQQVVITSTSSSSVGIIQIRLSSDDNIFQLRRA